MPGRKSPDRQLSAPPIAIRCPLRTRYHRLSHFVQSCAVYEGRTIRTFDSTTRLWRLYWVDSRGGPIDPPVIGSFSNGVGLFFGKDYQVGRPVIVVFRWDKTNPNQPLWSQAFSDDNGKTWEWNYTNTSYRVSP